MKWTTPAVAGALLVGVGLLLANAGGYRAAIHRLDDLDKSIVAVESLNGRTARAVAASYRAANYTLATGPQAAGQVDPAVTEVRGRAAADLDYARAERDRSRAAVERLLAEIKIEGAEGVELGGEIRAARMAEAEWQRAVDTVSAYLARLDYEIADMVE